MEEVVEEEILSCELMTVHFDMSRLGLVFSLGQAYT